MRPSDDADRLPSPRGGPVLASTSKFEGPFSCHEPVIEIKDLDFYYSDKPVLNNVTLAITQGSCLALIGPNGSGKSTLCKILPEDGDDQCPRLPLRFPNRVQGDLLLRRQRSPTAIPHRGGIHLVHPVSEVPIGSRETTSAWCDR